MASNAGSRAFTLVEATFAILIIALVSGLVLFAARNALVSTRAAAEQQRISSIRMGVEQFQQTFGFLPPLINDQDGPITSGRLDLRSDRFLSSQEGNPSDPRYSVYSLPYYVLGMGDTPGEGGRPIDGKPGPGLSEPRRDGTFASSGRAYEPFADVGSRDAERVVRGADGRVVIMDRWGVRGNQDFVGATPPANAIRYYRWSPRYGVSSPGVPAGLEQYLVPRVVGDAELNPALRDAKFAIVSVGPDGVTDDRRPLPSGRDDDSAVDAAPIDVEVTRDDIVEVGG